MSQKTPKKFSAWGPNRCWDIGFPTPLYICSSWPSYQVPILHPLVCQHLPISLKMFLCLSGISKTFGAWGPNRWWDIDFPMYLFNLTKIWALMLCLWVCQHLPRGVQMFLCVSENSKKFSAWGPNRCWDIDFPTPLYICSTWPSYQVPILHPLMCQHLPSCLKMFLCVSGFSKNLVYGALIDGEILTPPLPHVFAQLDPVFRHWHSACRCANTSKVV